MGFQRCYFAAIVLTLVATLPLQGCSNGDSADAVEIGVILPLTGNVASLGVPCHNGMVLAVEKFNADSPDLKVKLVPEDSNAEAKRAVSAFNKLADIDGVQAILGPLTSTEALAVAPLAEQKSVVLMSPGASTPALSAAGDFVFRNELSDERGGSVQAELAYDTLGYRDIAILYMNNDYGEGLYRVFRKTFEDLGGRVSTAEAFQPDRVDFRTHIAKIKQHSPDALFIVAVDEVVNILKQSRELGLDVPF